MDPPNLLPKYVSDRSLLKEFTFQIFEIGQIVILIKIKVKAWLKIPISIGSFQLLNHGHAHNELEDYLDYRWLPAPIRQYDLKGLIVTHFQKLGLVTQYCHKVYLDDSFFEDAGAFEDALRCMRARHIPKNKIVVLGQESKQERLE